MWHIPPPNSSLSFEVSAIFCSVKIEYISSAELMQSLEIYTGILLSMVGAVFDDFRAFQTAFKAFQNETNQLFIVKKCKSVDAVNIYNSVTLLYLTILNNFLLTQETHPPDHRVCNRNEIEYYLNNLNK